jgi:hypothetical protein
MAVSEKLPQGQSNGKVWKSCGYISRTKNPKVLLVMVKHQRFIVNISGLQAVNAEKLEFTPIYEYIGETKEVNKKNE